MAKHVKTDGSISDVAPEHGSGFSLEEMQGYVGGMIEIVATNSDLFVLVINEDGLRLNLPINPVATSMVSEVGLLMEGGIVGDVLIGTREEMGFN